MRRLIAALSLALCAAPAFAAMQARPVEWKVGKDRFSGVLVFDDASTSKRPGLVMVPNWMGVNNSAVEKAKQVAGDDYVVLVADVYGKGVHPKNAKEAGAQAKKAYADGGVSLRARANEAVKVLKAQAGKAPLDATRIGAFGFCFGGSTVLELARSGSDVAGVVSLHGDVDTYLPAAANTVRTSILVLNGADDSSVSDAQIAAFEKEMDAAKADWQFVDFSGAVHCFSQPESNDPPNCVYNERAAKRAFEMLHDFFRERFATSQ
ncbi:dienelactone hydrolase family protein [Lysobacter koreensis]|uniref:Dienelactone hydrolase family protein n=1 Tax=Lysobacter koreensis TaxID=266122 RepID=A0ABW2YS41_9GAMM